MSQNPYPYPYTLSAAALKGLKIPPIDVQDDWTTGPTDEAAPSIGADLSNRADDLIRNVGSKDTSDYSPQGPLSPPAPPAQLPRASVEPSALEGLRAAQGSDEASQAYGINTRMLREADRFPGQPQWKAQLERNIAESPITAQGRDVEDFMARQRSAQLQGFSSPQEQANAARKMEQQKMEMPLEEAKITGEYGLKGHQEQSRGQLELQKERNAGAEANYGNLLSMMQGGRPVSHLSTGPNPAVSFAPESKVPSPLTNQIAATRKAVADEGGGDRFFGMGKTASQQKLDQLLSSVYSTHPAPDHVKDIAHQIMSSPTNANLTFEQLIPKLRASDGSPLTPEEASSLRDLLGILKGQPF